MTTFYSFFFNSVILLMFSQKFYIFIMGLVSTGFGVNSGFSLLFSRISSFSFNFYIALFSLYLYGLRTGENIYRLFKDIGFIIFYLGV